MNNKALKTLLLCGAYLSANFFSVSAILPSNGGMDPDIVSPVNHRESLNNDNNYRGIQIHDESSDDESSDDESSDDESSDDESSDGEFYFWDDLDECTSILLQYFVEGGDPEVFPQTSIQKFLDRQRGAFERVFNGRLALLKRVNALFHKINDGDGDIAAFKEYLSVIRKILKWVCDHTEKLAEYCLCKRVRTGEPVIESIFEGVAHWNDAGKDEQNDEIFNSFVRLLKGILKIDFHERVDDLLAIEKILTTEVNNVPLWVSVYFNAKEVLKAYVDDVELECELGVSGKEKDLQNLRNRVQHYEFPLAEARSICFCNAD